MGFKCMDCGNMDNFYGYIDLKATVYFNSNEEIQEAYVPDVNVSGACIEHCADCDGANLEEGFWDDEEEDEEDE